MLSTEVSIYFINGTKHCAIIEGTAMVQNFEQMCRLVESPCTHTITTS